MNKIGAESIPAPQGAVRGSEKSSDIPQELFLRPNDLFGERFDRRVRISVLIEVMIKAFYAHRAAVGEEFGGGAVARMPCEAVGSHLNGGLGGGHDLSDGVRFFSTAAVGMQQSVSLAAQPVVFSLSGEHSVFQFIVSDVIDDIVDGGNAHLNARVSFAEKFYRIMFIHKNRSFRQ